VVGASASSHRSARRETERSSHDYQPCPPKWPNGGKHGTFPPDHLRLRPLARILFGPSLWWPPLFEGRNLFLPIKLLRGNSLSGPFTARFGGPWRAVFSSLISENARPPGWWRGSMFAFPFPSQNSHASGDKVCSAIGTGDPHSGAAKFLPGSSCCRFLLTPTSGRAVKAVIWTGPPRAIRPSFHGRAGPVLPLFLHSRRSIRWRRLPALFTQGRPKPGKFELVQTRGFSLNACPSISGWVLSAARFSVVLSSHGKAEQLIVPAVCFACKKPFGRMGPEQGRHRP